MIVIELIKKILYFISPILSYLQITFSGHFEHFIIGLLIGGLVSYLIFKKTGNKIISFIFGILITTLIGTLKEVTDPYVGGNADVFDLIYTFLGAFVGVLIILSKMSFWRKCYGRIKSIFYY